MVPTAAAATARCLALRSCATARATHAGHLTGDAAHAAGPSSCSRVNNCRHATVQSGTVRTPRCGVRSSRNRDRRTNRTSRPNSEIGLRRGSKGVTPVNIMLRDVTRSRLIQVWFVAIALVGAAVVAFGPAVALGTGAMLFVVSLVPPAILLALWPEAQSPTASDILHGTDRRA